VLVGNEQFSENHAWSEMPQYWPAGLVGRTVIEVANSPRPPQPPFEVRAFLDAP
jgi:hypothetical protein